MHPYIDSLFSSAALEKPLASIPQHAALNEHDREVIQRSRQAIQRSRELLNETKHQVLSPSERSDHGS